MGKIMVSILIDPPVGMALKVVLEALSDKVILCEKEDADVFIVGDMLLLHKVYDENKDFIILSMKEPVQEKPGNVVWYNILESVTELISYFSSFEKENIKKKTINLEIGVEYKSNNVEALKILVVDDKKENLKLALECLDQHHLTLANSYREGLDLINQNKYDVVLSDCQMPPDLTSSLSSEAIMVGRLVHNGIFLMFPATMSGAKFAIVTDANHHQDWASAIFDKMRDRQIVNGQPVMFFNYLGKKWDEALKILLSKEK